MKRAMLNFLLALFVGSSLSVAEDSPDAPAGVYQKIVSAKTKSGGVAGDILKNVFGATDEQYDAKPSEENFAVR